MGEWQNLTVCTSCFLVETQHDNPDIYDVTDEAPCPRCGDSGCLVRRQARWRSRSRRWLPWTWHRGYWEPRRKLREQPARTRDDDAARRLGDEMLRGMEGCDA